VSLVPLGLWLAIIGYGVAFAGMAKLGGDSHYTMGQGFRGVTPAAGPAASTPATTASGTSQSQLLASSQAAQASIIGAQPLTA
jgi:hypothetical protein